MARLLDTPHYADRVLNHTKCHQHQLDNAHPPKLVGQNGASL